MWSSHNVQQCGWPTWLQNNFTPSPNQSPSSTLQSQTTDERSSPVPVDPLSVVRALMSPQTTQQHQNNQQQEQQQQGSGIPTLAVEAEEKTARESLLETVVPLEAFFGSFVRATLRNGKRGSLCYVPTQWRKQYAQLIAEECVDSAIPDMLEWILHHNSGDIQGHVLIDRSVSAAMDAFPGPERQQRMECVFICSYMISQHQTHHPIHDRVEELYRRFSVPSYMKTLTFPSPWAAQSHEVFPTPHRMRVRAILFSLLNKVDRTSSSTVCEYLAPLCLRSNHVHDPKLSYNIAGNSPYMRTPPRQLRSLVDSGLTTGGISLFSPTPGPLAGSATSTSIEFSEAANTQRNAEYLIHIAQSPERILFRYPVTSGQALREFDISGGATQRFGLYHGQHIRKPIGHGMMENGSPQIIQEGVVIGVGADHALWWVRDGESVAVRLALIPQQIVKCVPIILGATVLRGCAES